MADADTNRLRLLAHRAFGPFHRLGDLRDRRPRLGVRLEVAYVLFGPRTAMGSHLPRHLLRSIHDEKVTRTELSDRPSGIAATCSTRQQCLQHRVRKSNSGRTPAAVRNLPRPFCGQGTSSTAPPPAVIRIAIAEAAFDGIKAALLCRQRWLRTTAQREWRLTSQMGGKRILVERRERGGQRSFKPQPRGLGVRPFATYPGGTSPQI